MGAEATDFVYDQHLVLRCQEGDAAAFDELLVRWQERVWRHARRLTGDPDAAWDVLQDTFLAVSQGIWRIENAACFRAWLYRIATNKSMDWVRSREREQRRIEQYANGLSEETPPDASKAADLLEAIALLPREDQSLLSLKYEGELSTAEIAGVFNIPEGTVKSRLYTLRQRLRASMEEKR